MSAFYYLSSLLLVILTSFGVGLDPSWSKFEKWVWHAVCYLFAIVLNLAGIASECKFLLKKTEGRK